MQKIDIEELLRKYRSGTLSAEELVILENWYLQWEPESLPLSFEEIEEKKNQVWQSLQPTKVRRLWPLIAAAASVLIFLSLGIYLMVHKTAPEPLAAQVIIPGGSKAILTLGNGKKISLTDAKNGLIDRQGAAKISKTANGQLVYSADLSGQAQMNRIEVPRAGEYHLVLSDGTQVWMNSASSLKYPTVFKGKERIVTLTGEAYFEVAHNRSMPFKVISGIQQVQVLGTHFDISAYADEPAVKTTLLEGSVKVTASGAAKVIRPGQQVVNNGNLLVTSANTEEAVAWKKGYFRFNNENIQTIMRQVGRWYNVDIQYAGTPSAEGFNGTISRYKNISQVLNMLEATEIVHFKIEGRRVTVR